MKKSVGLVLVALILLLQGGVAWASESAADMVQAGMNPDLAQFASAVSGNEGSWDSVNQYGCLGAFQFCPGTFQEYSGGVSEQQFLSDPAAQVAAYQRYMANGWAEAKRYGLTSAIGKETCWNGECATVSQSSILMACQFGCGQGGALADFVKNGYNCNGPLNTSDGNGTPVCKYLVTGSDYNVSAVTGESNDATAVAGASVSGGTSSLASYRAGNSDYSASTAAAARRSLYEELSHEVADGLRINENGLKAQDTLDVDLAELTLIEENKISR